MKPDSNNYYIRNEDFSETNVAPIIYIFMHQVNNLKEI